jgi:precorrin-6A synthase
MIQVIGIGMGLSQITAEAAAALRECDYIIAASKREDDGLLALRREVCQAYDLPLIVVPDPERDRDPESVKAGTAYVGAVKDWHTARVDAYRDVIATHARRPGFLVWGDPALYDSTIRIVRELDDDYSVIAGVSAPQLLAARHRIVLHEVGQPVLITTQRRLREAIAAGAENVVVMLTSGYDLDEDPHLADWHVWWGANLGTTSERLAADTVEQLGRLPQALREDAKTEAGWVMDLFLIRKPS